MTREDPLVLHSDSLVPCRPRELVSKARKELMSRLPNGFPLQDILIALEEAYSNILKHSLLPQDRPSARVTSWIDTLGFNLCLEEYGTAPLKCMMGDTRRKPGSEDLRNDVVATGGSMGLVLIHEVMDMICHDSGSQSRIHHFVKRTERISRMKEDLIMEMSKEKSLAHVAIQGCINMDTVDFFSERIEAFQNRENPLYYLIDAQRLEYVSSAGIGIFINLFDQLEPLGGMILFAGLKPDVRRVFELIGFMPLFGDFKNLEDARTYLENLKR